MMVFFSFVVHTDGGEKKSPSFYAGDEAILRKLFPDNSVWKGPETNIRHINVKQAKDLYNVMVTYYAVNGVSPESYPAGNFTGSFLVEGDQESLFDELLKFFEGELGFKASDAVAAEIAAKQQKRKLEKAEAASRYRADTQSFFEGLGTLGPVTDKEIRASLESKLGDYRRRLEKENFHPELAFKVRHKYRDAEYKIFVCGYVLSTKHGVRLVDLAMMQLNQRGDHFNVKEFFDACAVISVYIGTPLPGAEIEELVK